MSSPALHHACRNEPLCDPSGWSDGNNREGPPRPSSLVKIAAVVAVLSLSVSCSAISKILTDTGPDDGKWEETLTKGNRIPLPPSVDDFDPGRDTE